MKKKIRSLLLKTLGTETYLSLVSSTYIRLIRAGFLKAKYPELFYLENLVKPGFVCIDIGANVGYYSVFLSKFAGEQGHVYSVEPVPLFANVFLKNVKRFGGDNITLYQCALGAEKKEVILGTPVLEGVFRHGLTKIMDQPEGKDTMTYKAKMEIPDVLFGPLAKIDFIKCDVEGYEIYLFPQMLATLTRFKPLIQIELTGSDRRKTMIDLLKPLGYRPYKLNNEQLELMEDYFALDYEQGDFYFKVNSGN